MTLEYLLPNRVQLFWNIYILIWCSDFEYLLPNRVQSSWNIYYKKKAYSDFPKGGRTVGKGKNGCTLLPKERQDPLFRLLATYPDNFKADFLELPARNVHVNTVISIFNSRKGYEESMCIVSLYESKSN